MRGVSAIESIVAQAPPLGSDPATNSQTAAAIPELVIISIVLLLIATVVALVTQRLRIPYVTGLVLAGLPITEVLSRRIGLYQFTMKLHLIMLPGYNPNHREIKLLHL